MRKLLPPIRSMSQRRDVSPGIALWGDVMCQQLSLPTLNWECQRDKYPFFRDPITTALFAQSNPCAFQSLMHFLFTILDPIDASEKFFGLWPPKSGDKKAESQFRFVLNAFFTSLIPFWRESSFEIITFETQNWKLNFLDI